MKKNGYAKNKDDFLRRPQFVTSQNLPDVIKIG